VNEFWRIYRLVFARRWMILGLACLAIIAVLACKHVADTHRQFLATAVVLPSAKAMAAGGVYKDSGNGVLSQTYDRMSRMALFTQSIRSRQDAAVEMVGESTRQQKQVVALALSNQLAPASRARIAAPDASISDIDAVLKIFKVPTDSASWAPRTITPELQKEIRDGLDVAPYYEAAVNSAPPGNTTPSPTMTDDIQISVHAPDPIFAQQLATLTAATFVNWYHDTGKEEYSDSIFRVKQNQQQAKTALDTAQNDLVNFKSKTGLINLPSQIVASSLNLETLRQQRDNVQAQLSSDSASAATLKSQLAGVPKQTVTDLPPQSRPEVQALETKITNDEADISVKASRYTPENPVFINAQSVLEADKAGLTKLLKQPYEVANVNPNYAPLEAQTHAAEALAAADQAKFNTLNAQIQALEASNSKTLPEAEKKYNGLQNAVLTAQRNKTAADSAYASLMQTSKALDNGLITLTNPATYATPDASGPGLAALLVYAVVISLVFSIGITLALDALDNRVQTVGDAEKLLGMSISAVIPAMPPGDPRRMTRMIVADPLSPVAEAYRLLRTDLLFTAEDKPFKSLMGATAKPGQGATTTICNLAVALAQVGKRVILIDADLRRPKLHDFFSVSNETGLTSLLRNECELEEALKLTDIDNLLLLPSGPLPLNPSELLASPRMRTLHERMKPHTDFILVDTPSAIAFSDSAILASFMDAVLLVMRAQEAPRGGEARVRELLTKARANVVGVVLNGVKPQLVDSYHYHAAYYPQLETSALPQTGNGRALPAPPDEPALLPPTITDGLPNGNGYAPNGNHVQSNGYEPTLMGVRLDHHLHIVKPSSDTPEPGSDEALPHETDAVGAAAGPMNGERPAKSRFNWRSMFGTDGPDEE
jgi:succinoglycan biosynthesis transport protein ExoP